MLAGPLAGATLAAMGATSVRFEEPQRLDLYRRNGPFQSGVPGLERAAYYLFGNFSKRNVSRRVGSDPEFSAAVNVWADLVLENVGAGRLERLGLAPPAGVDKTLISMSGFGRTGPAAAYKAYAGNVAAFAGIAGAVRELSDPRAVGGSLFPDCKIRLVGRDAGRGVVARRRRTVSLRPVDGRGGGVGPQRLASRRVRVRRHRRSLRI